MITTIRDVTNAITNLTFTQYPTIQIWMICFYSPINIRKVPSEVKCWGEQNSCR